MYFWNTNKLIDDLKNERLATSDYKNYYLAGGVGALLMVFCMRFSPVTNMILSTIDIVLSIIMLIIGINLCFRVNGGNQGRQFLNRLICIVLPISIRILLVYFLFFIFFNDFVKFYHHHLQLFVAHSPSLLQYLQEMLLH